MAITWGLPAQLTDANELLVQEILLVLRNTGLIHTRLQYRKACIHQLTNRAQCMYSSDHAHSGSL